MAGEGNQVEGQGHGQGGLTGKGNGLGPTVALQHLLGGWLGR